MFLYVLFFGIATIFLAEALACVGVMYAAAAEDAAEARELEEA